LDSLFEFKKTNSDPEKILAGKGVNEFLEQKTFF
jgi:hypothetical protein